MKSNNERIGRARRLWGLAGCIAGLAPVLHAHGGTFPSQPPPPPPTYNGPGDTGGGTGTSPTSPGTNGPSPGTPSPTAPTTPGAGSPGTPGPSSNIPTGPQSGQTLGQIFDLSDWTFWWEFNKEPLLALRSHLYAPEVTTGSEGYFLGLGARRQGARPSARPSDAVIRQKVVPALRAALADEQSNDVITACLVALARIGADHQGSEQVAFVELIQPFLKSSSQEVAETAAAALGILGNESAALLLSELVVNSPLGQKTVSATRVGVRTRAFAAYALGLIGAQTAREDVRRYAVHQLARALSEDDTPTADLGVACVLSLGRIPLNWSLAAQTPPAKGDLKRKSALPATASREAQLEFLLGVLERKKTHRIVRAFVPTALGQLLAADSVRYEGPYLERVGRELVTRLDPRKREPREVRQSCALALGLIGDDDDDPLDQTIRHGLRRSDPDTIVQHFALLSLGRVAARSGGGRSDAERVVDDLLRIVSKRGSDDARWAAISLALFQRARAAQGDAARSEVLDALRERLRRATAPLDAGAFAISAGLAVDLDAEALLAEQLSSLGQDAPRGYAALGLGLLGAQRRAEEIRSVANQSTYRPLLLRETAIALGLLGDSEAAPLLAERLEGARSLASQASIAQAVGRIGDSTTIDPLIELLQDPSQTERARAFAAVALGIVADKDDLPWNTWISVDINYTAAPPTLYDPRGFGILNIL